MIVSQVLDIIDENVNVYVRDVLTNELITCRNGKNNIADHVLSNVVECMTTTRNGNDIVLKIMYDDTDFYDLNGEAKLNCLLNYVYKICPYEHFDNMSISEIEECALEFWRQSDYTLDKYGNWYDEDFNRI